MARMHSVNCQNHVVTNIVKWIRKWVIWKLGKHLRHFLSTDHFNDVVSFTMREVTRNDDEEEDHFLPERVINAVTIQQLELMFDCIEHYINKLKDILEKQPLDEDSLKASWWTYLKPMSRILKTFVKNHITDAEARVENGVRGRGLRLFSLTPISSFKQKFILIDTDALHDLMTSQDIGMQVPNKESFRENTLEWWRTAFDVDKLTTATKRFAFSISTDGVQYHQHNLKQHIRSNINDWGYDFGGEFHEMELQPETRVVALDPGRGSLYMAASGNTPDDIQECKTK
ncbi:hypothetical protein MP638_006773, partial [Amoeboaphelidium occidentale]